MKKHRTGCALVTLSATLLLLACHPPPSAGEDVSGGDVQRDAQRLSPLSHLVPKVSAITGACDASLYLDVGGFIVRLKVDAAAGHDHVGSGGAATVAIESPIMSYACTFERGAQKDCAPQPPAPVLLPAPTSAAPALPDAVPADGEHDTTDPVVEL